jgi:hypothetical protein
MVLLCFILTFSVNAQEEVRTELRDTALTLLRMKHPELLLEKPITVLPLTFAIAAPDQNMQMSLYQTFAGTPQSFAWNRDEKIDLTGPLKLQLKDQEKERPWRITLGAAQTAGAAYLAYRYLKKYGLK